MCIYIYIYIYITFIKDVLAARSLGSAFQSLAVREVLQLVMGEPGLAALAFDPTTVLGHGEGKNNKAVYSDVNFDSRISSVTFSDDFLRLFFVPVDENTGAVSAWGDFVSLDQISSVVLHSERRMRTVGRRQLLHPGMCTGTWLTINGPRVCWGRKLRTRMDTVKDKEEKEEIGTGISWGNALPEALTRGDSIPSVVLTLRFLSANLPEELLASPRSTMNTPLNSRLSPMSTMEEGFGRKPEYMLSRSELDSAGIEVARDTQLTLHLLGRSFKSNIIATVSGDPYQYTLEAKAEVPTSNSHSNNSNSNIKSQ